jgi:lipopolysaccharide/colanic/teichoic acid biosynthesis glycosyltransferase
VVEEAQKRGLPVSDRRPVVVRAPGSDARPMRAYHAAKRAFDIVLAAAVLLLSAPLLLVAAIAIRLDSPGPALYRQERMGLNGRRFELVKLRGMYADARARFPEHYDYSRIDPGATTEYGFHRPNDPRVTRVGRVIRRFSIDELPNFWNVLRGDMSVVGPRPEIPDLAHLYGGDLDLFLSVRPGVTSPAKALGRDALSFASTLEMELEYVRNRSFWLDLTVIGRTILGVVRAKGVH